MENLDQQQLLHLLNALPEQPKKLDILLIDDPKLKEDFNFVWAELRLGNLKDEEVKLVKEWLAAAYQLYMMQNKYKKKGVPLDLTETIKMILAEAISLIIASRSRKGFERRMLATNIYHLQARDMAEKKERKSLFMGIFRRGD